MQLKLFTQDCLGWGGEFLANPLHADIELIFLYSPSQLMEGFSFGMTSPHGTSWLVDIPIS